MSEHSGQNLDLTFLYEIADGSNEFIVESIEMFLQHTPALLKEIEDAIAVQTWPVAASAAHKLKPNLGFFGMTDSQSLAQELEFMAKSGSPDINEISSMFKQLQNSLQGNLEKLDQIKAEAAAQL